MWLIWFELLHHTNVFRKLASSPELGGRSTRQCGPSPVLHFRESSASRICLPWVYALIRDGADHTQSLSISDLPLSQTPLPWADFSEFVMEPHPRVFMGSWLGAQGQFLLVPKDCVVLGVQLGFPTCRVSASSLPTLSSV